jgi:predicted HTH domain antitoxin
LKSKEKEWVLLLSTLFFGTDIPNSQALAFEALVVRLYALGELSSGEGAKLLGLTRREFLDLLGQYNVSLFDDEIDLKKEAGYA